MHFIDTDGRTRIGPWLLLDTEAEVDAIIASGHPSPEDLADHPRSMRMCSRDSIPLHLTDRDRLGLIARARGWPWNGHELGKMKAAGKYPPPRLSPAQEGSFTERYRRHG